MRTQNPDFELQTPDPEELKKVEPLLDLIETEMSNNGGRLSFNKFMELALYTPALGYYTGNNAIFGSQGDFVTAPELTPLFSRCIARQIQQIHQGIPGEADVLEFGAGAGTMATDILLELKSLNALPRHYYIVEISPMLQKRQREKISSYVPELMDKISWVTEIPEKFKGAVIGNEILDAIPTHRVRLNPDGNHQELFVTVEDNRFVWQAGEFSDPALQNYCDAIYEKHLQDSSGAYETEINLDSFKWIKQVADALEEGVVLLIDYGYSDQEFYRPEHREGTLMCHYKHLAHPDALLHVGLQDITSHVNFTQVAEAGFEQGMSVLGFTTQTYFLIGCGLENLLAEIDIADTVQFLKETQPIKQLILPDEMGELFKVIAFGKNFSQPLLGFMANNQLERL